MFNGSRKMVEWIDGCNGIVHSGMRGEYNVSISHCTGYNSAARDGEGVRNGRRGRRGLAY